MHIPRTAPPYPRSGSSTRVIGHRGDPTRYPENSIAGILAAADFASMAEIDVRPTRDGRLVLSHDPQRGDVVLAEHDWIDLAATEIGGGHRLGLLGDLMSQADDIPLNIEIKNWPHNPDFDDSFGLAIRAAGYARDIDLITSFHWPTMHAIRRAHPSVRTGLVVDEGWSVEAARDEAYAYGHDALALHHSLISTDPDGVLAAVAPLSVIVWTVNDLTLGVLLADSDVYGLITDDPRSMVAALQGEPA